MSDLSVNIGELQMKNPVMTASGTFGYGEEFSDFKMCIRDRVLAAQYESWTSPVAAVIGLPVALLGAMIGCLVMGTPVSIYTQIGIILLVALSAKNGILIVEFARDFHAEGNSIRESAFEAGHVMLRPIDVYKRQGISYPR